jgi:chromosome segregation ATPase
MKRALSVAAVTALSLLVFLFVGYAQEEGAQAVSELLGQELATMESAFSGLQAFMSELIYDVKGNMAGINDLGDDIGDLRDVVKAISVEIKDVEGKVVGLRDDVDSLSDVQQELKVRIVALEAGISELSAFCEQLKARLDVSNADLSALREDFDALFGSYTSFQEDYAAFQQSIYGDLDALRESVYRDFETLSAGVYGDLDALGLSFYEELDALRVSFYGDLDALREGVRADFSLLRAQFEDLAIRLQALEDEDVGTFKKKVIELERTMAAVAIRVDNNRSKLEGFDHAIAGLAQEMAATREGILESNQQLLSEYDARLQVLEESDLEARLDTVFFISIVALLAGVGALIWGFLGNQ